jgi:8-amino-7-oxononanoate synthase
MMVRAVMPPTVPLGTGRVRICLHAGNTVYQVQELVRVLEEWCQAKSLELVGDVAQQTELGAKL